MASLHRRLRPVSIVASVAASCVIAGACASSASALSAVTPRVVTTDAHFNDLTATALPDGRAAVGWTSYSPTAQFVRALVRPAGGVFPSTPQNISRDPGETIGFVPGGPGGSSTFAFWENTSARSALTAPLVGDSFSGAQTMVGSSDGRFGEFARCPDGTTVFGRMSVYDAPPAATTYSYLASLADANGVPSSGGYGLTTSSLDPFQTAKVTCDDGVPIAVVANDQDDSGSGPEKLIAQVIGSGVGTGIALNRTLAAGVSVSNPTARAGADGRIWIAWTEYGATSNPSGTGYIATRAPRGTGGGTPISLGDGTVQQLFFDAAGDTFVLVSHIVGMGAPITYGLREAPAGSGTLGPEVPIATPTDSTQLEAIEGAPDGNPRLAQYQPTGSFTGPFTVSLRGIPQAGSGSDVTPLGLTLTNSPLLKWLPSGDLLAIGVNAPATGDPQLLEGGLDSGVPPTIDAVAVPGAVVAGQDVPVSAVAKDPLGLGSFAWTVSGGGLAAPQTYATQSATITGLAAGTYTVTATAADRAGNPTAVSRTLRVIDPAAGAGGAVIGGNTTTPLDKTAPTLKIGTATRGHSGTAAKTVTVVLQPSEITAADLDLIGTVSRGGQKGTLVLLSKHVASVTPGKATTITLKVPTALIPFVSPKISVRVTLTDAAGNRAVTTVPVKLAKTAKKTK